MIDMKTIFRKSTTTLLIAIIFTAGLMAQQGQGQGLNQNAECKLSKVIPDLTEDQIASLKELRADQLKSSQTYRNQMGEIRARQRTLMSETPLDQKAAEKLIDEKTALSNKHLKESLAHKVALSKVLTEEQQLAMKQMKNRRAQFAKRAGRGNGNFGKGRAHAGQGKGFGQGRRGGQARLGGQHKNFKQHTGQRW
jgi:Spy/CpxP family protein refolding chaperone